MVPWRYIESWSCYGCGEICCGSPLVPLTTSEWVKIVQSFGVEVTEASLNGLYLKKRTDNRCVFQYTYGEKEICTIQEMKPTACKLWPLKISKRPIYGKQDEALFTYNGEPFYVYVDTLCEGVRWGRPSKHFTERVVPEFIEISLGVRRRQVYSTSSLIPPKIPFKPGYAKVFYL